MTIWLQRKSGLERIMGIAETDIGRLRKPTASSVTNINNGELPAAANSAKAISMGMAQMVKTEPIVTARSNPASRAITP